MKETRGEKRRKDKSDRATVDKVLDKKTLKVLEKLEDRGKLSNLEGSLCTGKESNVYLAEASTALCSKFIKNKYVEAEEADNLEQMIPVVVKIFKTSIMSFRDRERYIRSEKRFQRFCTSNSRKLIKVWAEKEVRNLKRLNNAGIPSPEPIYLKNNILIMSRVGNHEVVAPKLRDAIIEDIMGCYLQCVEVIRSMYKRAGLVHADLSEFNLLYFEGVVYVIDVGQSVEIDHDNAQSFLIMDINNINNFFSKKGVEVIRGNDLFEEITGNVIPPYLKDMDIVKDVFIPSRVSEVGNLEDLAAFSVEKKDYGKTEMSLEYSDASEDEIENSDTRLEAMEIENTEDAKEEKKKRKKTVKEMNRIRRASRISKKEKKKIFKKYIGMKKKRR
ncbi:putative RIO kinase [Encephalitozoon hellem ATCC 50504]|uniref:non-specific serine/threonine protein kinase n=1 Tax=Encephalitozoon hellem TaxID=27973 RepID=A0A9Q9C846_ENCHE|nr:putative RIO kinase [Encephalitozoon hellem ATCC 50504]AFM98326.1 putative RIO kinase [Encephalitozoon hellem ATCC 50504]UTX43205.1 RIO-like kinase [Encephalitozoon hellem]WEL38662.1 RIO-like kinase [Encephalitozoon hellem]|eukprot:XP_003887307.1 putative RIO kinase [Encephalitozoon hellem ATCC 50504]